MNSTFIKKYGPWSLVTGAARGLGKEFALQCAERGLNVLMADIREKELIDAAASIRDSTVIVFTILCVDKRAHYIYTTISLSNTPFLYTITEITFVLIFDNRAE